MRSSIVLLLLLSACRRDKDGLPPDFFMPDTGGLEDTDDTDPVDTDPLDTGDTDTGDTVPPGDVDADGFTVAQGDCDDADAGVYPGAEELCDGLDQDCDGVVDDGVLGAFWADADQDGHGDAGAPVEACDGGINATNSDDCDDARADVHRGAEEACDGVDSDCDGAIDEEGLSLWFTDGDGDGYGDPATGVAACAAAGRVADYRDCDDADAAVNPAAVEVCDGVDQDCDGGTDEGAGSVWYIDYDGDGSGSAAYVARSCDAPAGWAADADDCDDTEAAVFPGAVEVCNAIDDDCDGTIDEPDAVDAATWYADVDGDGWGDAASATVSCDAAGVADATDCDDADARVHPDAAERYDGLDNDCDGVVDDNTWIGTGADGPLVVDAATDLSTGDGVAYAVSALAGADVSLSAAAAGIAAGDEVLLINLHGSDAAHASVGSYEFAWVAAVAGDVVTLETPVSGVYGEIDNADLIDQAVVLQRVPQYTDVTVGAAGLLTTAAWDGATGGIVAFRATGAVTVAAGGAIAVDELGYAGGQTGTVWDGDAYQGESFAGAGDGDVVGASGYNEYLGYWAANYGGGGAHVTGGGGEHAGGATAGASWTGGSATPPEAGDPYGSADLGALYFGSGGGGVWRGYNDPGPGGSGGGLLFIGASAITGEAGSLTTIGGTTTHWATGSWTYGAGGGAGGSLWIVADTLTLTGDALDAGGGWGESTHIRAGGDGGEGRIRVECNEINGLACDAPDGAAQLDGAAVPDPGWIEAP